MKPGNNPCKTKLDPFFTKTSFFALHRCNGKQAHTQKHWNTKHEETHAAQTHVLKWQMQMAKTCLLCQFDKTLANEANVSLHNTFPLLSEEEQMS